MTARLYRVIVPVNDIEAAERFYAAVLDTPGTRVSPGRHYFDCEGTILACFDPKADGDAHEAVPNHEWIYFAVDDLERTAGAFRDAFGDASCEIQTQPWGERSFYDRDPFGNKICFVERSTVFTGANTDQG